MRDLLRKAKPERLDDLIALNALYRPGPLRAGSWTTYIARKHGRTEVKYELPQMEPILSDTYGVIAYQEQVMRIAACSPASRWARPTSCGRPWGRRTPEGHGQAARSVHQRLRRTNGISEKKAAKIFDLMEFFAGYGFNKSHSTTYALLALSDGVPESELPGAISWPRC